MVHTIPELRAYQARPDQSLASHLGGVVDNINAVTTTDTTTAYSDDWQTVMETLGWLHDAGKLTTYFQRYLETGTRSVADRPEHTYHGFLSALLTTHALASLDVSEEMRTAGFYAIAKHHSVIPTLERDHADYTGTRERVAGKYDPARVQLQDIDENASVAADALLQQATNGQLSWDNIHTDEPELYKRYLPNPSQFDEHFYETVLRAWSTLVCADKLNAAGIQPPSDPTRPAVETLRSKIDALPAGETPLEHELNNLRSAAHEECHQTLQSAHNSGDRLFQLTLPTGFGKTLSGLRACLELAEEQDSRVIYALPYTSILDQVDSVCREKLNVDPFGEEYTIHHHLADTRTTVSKRSKTEEPSDGTESLYAETWQSGLVLTTFTQLFESAAGPQNTQAMKLPALQESIILLDEPQGLPLDWWDLVARLAEALIEEYDATVIGMTATQPQIFEQAPNLPSPTPLTETTAACREFLDEHPRVEFVLHDSLLAHLDNEADATILIKAAATELATAATAGSNTLAVVNTVRSAAEMIEALHENASAGERYVQLAGQLQQFYQSGRIAETTDSALATTYLEYLADRVLLDDGTTVTLALTTRLRPRDRQLLLDALRQILNDETSTPFDACATVTVSTQLIEAGVDISFDQLYRDFAPLPALVQAAGRCNRAFDGETGTVTVWRLASPEGGTTPPSSLIYGRKSLLRPARDALASLRETHGDCIDEAAMIGTGVDDYYTALHTQRRTGDRSDSLVASFNDGDGETLRHASLINDDWATQDVVVLVSADDVAQFERYTDRSSDDMADAQQQFAELKPLIVTIPVSDGERSDAGTLEVIDATNVSDRYEIETGLGITREQVQFGSEW